MYTYLYTGNLVEKSTNGVRRILSDDTGSTSYDRNSIQLGWVHAIVVLSSRLLPVAAANQQP
jgi:hypothetical protein